MRERGLKPTSCNNQIRAINAYLKWSGSALRIPRLKEERRVLPTFAMADVKKLVAWKSKRPSGSRLHTIMMTLIDTGCRIDEALSLRWDDCDFENLLLTVSGKGANERKVPMSFELRRFLWKHQQRGRQGELVFTTRDGRKLSRRDVLRDVKNICGKLGIRTPERTLHAFRHTFAMNYYAITGRCFTFKRFWGTPVWK